MKFEHKSVLLKETIENLNIKNDGIYVDGTLGGGGHSYEIVKQLGTGRLIGIDQDETAIDAASKRLEEYKDKVTIIRKNYSQMKEIMQDLQIPEVDGILLDLGVSSHQFDNFDRGFSYRKEAPLDMRMDVRNPKTAKDIVNNYDEDRLFKIIKDYGEERFARNIAREIVRRRAEKEIETTIELNEIIDSSIPRKFKINTGHPSAKTYQAIRIEVNRELEVLTDTIDDMIELLAPGGRLCIISFHSLEDRIVKLAYRNHEDPCSCPRDFPICICGKTSSGKATTRKPIIPSQGEIEENTRSKSAKLRVFEKI